MSDSQCWQLPYILIGRDADTTVYYTSIFAIINFLSDEGAKRPKLDEEEPVNGSVAVDDEAMEEEVRVSHVV